MEFHGYTPDSRNETLPQPSARGSVHLVQPTTDELGFGSQLEPFKSPPPAGLVVLGAGDLVRGSVGETAHCGEVECECPLKPPA